MAAGMRSARLAGAGDRPAPLATRSARVARGQRLVCPANAPLEGPAIPVSREDLIEHIRSGCKPRDRWRIGTEHEKLGFRLADRRRMDYDEVRQVFEKLHSRFGWQPIKEGDLTIGATLDGQSVTLEPGGQFELSGAPLATLHQTCAEVNSHLYQAKSIAEELGIGFMGIGFDPKWRIDEIPVMPKDRYRLMKAYMPTVGKRGLDMMFRTCTIQVNLDYESEADMIEKFRIGLALQPVAVALFANSPFTEGKPTGELSTRARVWMDVDAARTGGLPFVFDDDMSFERYVDYAMDVPMYFVYRKGKYINTLGMSWRDFMEVGGGAPGGWGGHGSLQQVWLAGGAQAQARQRLPQAGGRRRGQQGTAGQRQGTAPPLRRASAAPPRPRSHPPPAPSSRHPPGQAARAAGRAAHHRRLGEPPDHHLPGRAAEALPRDARRRRRAVAPDLRAAGAVGGADLRRAGAGGGAGPGARLEPGRPGLLEIRGGCRGNGEGWGEGVKGRGAGAGVGGWQRVEGAVAAPC
jgi:hypothetical protein